MFPIIKIAQLKDYISKHEGDSGGSWENEHYFYIEDFINQLTEKETVLLISEMWNWSEFHLYCLAAPILDCVNLYLDEKLIYAQIFSKINREEYIFFFSQNLQTSIRNNDLSNWDLELLKGIQTNLLIAMNNVRSIDSCIKYYNLIKKEIQNRT